MRTSLPGRAGRRTRGVRWGQVGIHVVLGLILALAMVPLAMLLILAGKTGYQYDAHPWTITLPYHFEFLVRMARGLWRSVANTLGVALGTVCIAGILASYTSFIFARFAFPGREVLYFLIVALMMMPPVLMLVPRFIVVRQMGLVNSLWALVLPFASGQAVFGIFLLRPFFAGLHEELFEAARMDGASDLQAYASIGLPLSRSIMATFSIITFLSVWRGFVWPSVVLSSSRLYTVMLSILSLAISEQYEALWGIRYAGFVVASLPVICLYAFAGKLFVKGLAEGALKL